MNKILDLIALITVGGILSIIFGAFIYTIYANGFTVPLLMVLSIGGAFIWAVNRIENRRL